MMDWKKCVHDSEYFSDLRLMHANRMGVHKSPVVDALTCFLTGCGVCVECRTFKCYMCHENMWECVCDVGNIRLQPGLMLIPFDVYWDILKKNIT